LLVAGVLVVVLGGASTVRRALARTRSDDAQAAAEAAGTLP
jgi:hypothetical protein